MENTTVDLFDLQIDQPVTGYLNETAKWAKFLAIIGFIMCALLVLVGVFAASYLTSSMGAFNGGGGLSVFFTVLYIAMAVIYFFPCLFLYHFANKMQRALRQNDQAQFTDSFRNLKSCYKYMGILFLVVIGIYVLIFISTFATNF